MEKVLIVDEPGEIRTKFKMPPDGDYTVLQASDTETALSLFQKQRPKVVVLGIRSAAGEGSAAELRCVDEMLAVSSFTKIIMVIESDDTDNGACFLRNRIHGFLRKPVCRGELEAAVRQAFHLHAVEEENRKLRASFDRKNGAMAGIIGRCPAMLQALSMIRKVAVSDAAVLMEGESGTGKELAARAIHAASRRRERDFTIIHCGAVPENMLETELFGLDREGPDGGSTRIPGRIEQARGGTLFLDEIAELSPALQVRLLRLLQDSTIRQTGSESDQHVDVRIIAATSRNLPDEIRNSRFREDLYYRIGVVTIPLPPLRERQEDLVLLSAFFLMRYSDQFKKRFRGFSSEAMKKMEAHGWPGNVRELESRIQAGVILSDGLVIEAHDLGFSSRPASPAMIMPLTTTLKDARDRVERLLMIQAMDRRKGNIAQAAEDLGISRPTFYDIMKKHGLFAA